MTVLWHLNRRTGFHWLSVCLLPSAARQPSDRCRGGSNPRQLHSSGETWSHAACRRLLPPVALSVPLPVLPRRRLLPSLPRVLAASLRYSPTTALNASHLGATQRSHTAPTGAAASQVKDTSKIAQGDWVRLWMPDFNVAGNRLDDYLYGDNLVDSGNIGEECEAWTDPREGS